MNRMVMMTAFASALALASLAAPGFAGAADKRICIDCIPGGGNAGPGIQNEQDQGIPDRHTKRFQLPDDQNGQGQDQIFQHRRNKVFVPNDQYQQQGLGQDQVIPHRRKVFVPNDQFQQGGNDNDVVVDKYKSKHAWKYDSNKHERRHHRDNRFRFFFGGFWYPEPYWDEPYYDDDYFYSRVSCREGAEIVSERFDRVRILECDGRVFTYLGRRHGDTFEIKLSSRTGRILDVNEI